MTNPTPVPVSASQFVAFETKLLTLDHLPQIMSLQQCVQKALPKGEENAIIAKSAAQFEARMTKLGKMFGTFAVTDKNAAPELIAYGGLAFPTSDWPVADMVLAQGLLPCDHAVLAVIQSNVVHPDFRNRGIIGELTKARMAFCLAQGRPHVMAEIAVFNPASLKGLLKLGFAVTQTGIDPDDGCKLLYVYKNLEKPFAPINHDHVIIINPDKNERSFGLVKGLLKRNYIGRSIERIGKTSAYMLNMYPAAPH